MGIDLNPIEYHESMDFHFDIVVLTLWMLLYSCSREGCSKHVVCVDVKGPAFSRLEDRRRKLELKLE